MSNPRGRRALVAVALACGLGSMSGCMVAEEALDAQGEDVLASEAEVVAWNGSEYLFFTIPATWEQARALCLSIDHRLVSINSQEEQDWLLTQEVQRGGWRWWIGYSDNGFEGVWIWEDARNTLYRNWYPGKPDNSGGNQNCGYVNSDNGYWDDHDCTTLHRYVCEREPR